MTSVIPAHREVNATPGADPTRGDGMARRHTILVVDDEPEVVRSVQDLLRLEFRVLGATKAAEGLRLLHEQEVHVVMTDQRMPEMTGVEFLSRVRGEHPDAIRLLFTGYADLRAVIDAINQGNVFRYITKPWDPDELQATLRQASAQYDLLVERKRLLTELKAKNQELERANAELRTHNELKEAFIRVASHELRTPLTILYGLTYLAVHTPGVTPPLLKWLQSIETASARLNRLVDQLVQSLQAGNFARHLERRPTGLTALLQQAADDVRPFLELRHQDLTMDLAADLGSLAVEAGKIRDSVAHLLLNAIKFTPDRGSIRLAARREADGTALIQVADTGVGIEPANLPRVFDAFFTEFNVGQHSSGQFEFGRRGLGLGLSLVKAFVEMHGGCVDAASTPGQGSTFTIRLPARPEVVG